MRKLLPKGSLSIQNSIWTLFSAVLMLFVSWQFIILPFTGNDEPWHSTRAYAGAHLSTIFGVPKGERPINFHGGPVKAPAWVYGRSIKDPSKQDWRCFIHQTAVPATCAGYNWSDNAATNDPHPDSEYSPLGYFLIGLPTLFSHGEFAYYAMRGLTALLTFGLFFLPLFSYYKIYVKRIPFLLMMCLIPSVMMNVSTINIDGLTLGASVGTGLLVIAGLLDPNICKSRRWLMTLVFYSSLLVLFRQFGDAQLFAIMVFAFILRLSRFWEWALWVVPSVLFELWRSNTYPFSFPYAVNTGLVPHASWIDTFFASVISVLQGTVFDFLQGDFQEAHIPLGITIIFGLWIVGVTARYFDSTNKRVVAATFSYLFVFLLYSSFANNINPVVWFLPWQGRYSYPALLTLFVFIWGLSLKSKFSQISARTAFAIWIFMMLIGFRIAIVRFYQGVQSPNTLAWYTHLIGLTGRSSALGGYRTLIGLTLFVLSSTLIAIVLFSKEEQIRIQFSANPKQRG